MLKNLHLFPCYSFFIPKPKKKSKKLIEKIAQLKKNNYSLL